MNKKKNLVDGPIFSSLIKFTIPILISMLLQTTYGTADLLIVGQFCDTPNVSGVSLASQLTQVVTSFCVGLSMGTTILIGQYIGEKRNNKAADIVGVSVFMFSIIAIFSSLILVLLSSQLCTWMNAPKESFDYAVSYLLISGSGTIFIVMYNLLGSIFRGIGDSKTPLITVSIACVVNILLDLLFVGVFSMGASGAAVATVIAQAISVFLSILVVKKNGLPFEFSKKLIRYDKDYILHILKIGIPAAIQAVLSGFSFLVLTSIMNQMGVYASAAVGIVSKITGIILVVPLAFSQSLSAFTAQNYGAGRMDRAKKGLSYAIIVAISIGAVMTYLSFCHGRMFTILFTHDELTTVASLSYLKSYSVDCMLVAVMFSMNGYFNGCSKTTFVMIQSVAGAFLVRIPLSYWFSTFENTSLFLIGLAIPASTVVQIISSFIYFKKTNHQIDDLSRM